MTPKFSKALLAAGLAAALVGCGGGSSTTMNPDSDGSMNEPTEPTEPTEADALDRAYETVKSLVDDLSADSSSADFTEAKSARTALLNRLLAVTDVSEEKQNDLNTKLGALKTEIDTKKEAMEERVSNESTARENTRIAGLFPKALSDPTLGKIGWPTATTLAGTPTTVNGLPDGWEGMNYDYTRPTKHEQGKTFSMEVEKVTPEIKMTWTRLAALSPLADRGDVINNYLGGPQIQLQAITETPESSIVAGIDGTSTDVEGSGLITTTINPTKALVVETESSHFDEARTQVTQFRREHFTAMTELDLETSPDITNNSYQVWADLDKPTGASLIDNNGKAVPIRWRGIPGILSFRSSASSVNAQLRFNSEGFLEISVNEAVSLEDTLSIDFRPSSSNNRKYSVLTIGLHDEDLILINGETTTATTEFAYWNSESSSKVTLSTFARGMDFDPVTTMPVALTGEATYNGLAAGYYTMGTDSNGEFTAEVMLTADFGTNMIDGKISNFMPMEGDDNLSSWNLALGSASFINNQDTDDTMDDRFMNFMGNTDGGGALGTWNGQFLGMANPGINLEDAADMTDDYPEAVVGNFTGHFVNNGHVKGAFGTELSAADKN